LIRLLLNSFILLWLLKSILIILNTILKIILWFLCINSLIFFTKRNTSSTSSLVTHHTYRFTSSLISSAILIELRKSIILRNIRCDSSFIQIYARICCMHIYRSSILVFLNRLRRCCLFNMLLFLRTLTHSRSLIHYTTVFFI
jgi:hypothetical protein